MVHISGNDPDSLSAENNFPGERLKQGVGKGSGSRVGRSGREAVHRCCDDGAAIDMMVSDSEPS